jgi:hypothetical protein
VRSASPPRCARRPPRSPWCGPTPGTQARFVRDAPKIGDLAVAIVKRPDQAKGFVLLHRRWVVERSFAWLTKFRRLIRHDETLPATHEAMICTAATWQLSNRLTR